MVTCINRAIVGFYERAARYQNLKRKAQYNGKSDRMAEMIHLAFCSIDGRPGPAVRVARYFIEYDFNFATHGFCRCCSKLRSTRV